MLPDSDAPQNANGPFYEFTFGILNGDKGYRRILPEGEYAKINQAHMRPRRKSLLEAARARALELRRRLDSTPGMTRASLARELGVSRARITQILGGA